MLNEKYRKLHKELGIPADYGRDGYPSYYPETTTLVEVGPNLLGRPQYLREDAAGHWFNLVKAALSDGIELLMVSGFRNIEYQADLIRRKLEAGQEISQILRVNAAPGFSQHHTGCAVDIATPGTRPLTEEFDKTDAFAWLVEKAVKFDFSMTYPRDNRFGFIYEPWHWALNSKIGEQEFIVSKSAD